MLKKFARIHIGLRTVKTTAAVVISMMLVYLYGTTDSRYIFAMLGAMAAVQPTFKESLEACMTQLIGVLFGAVMGLLLMLLPIHPIIQCAIGIVLVITLYNVLRIRFSPSLPCMIVVVLCTAPDIQPISYALCRIWDSAIGLAVGMVINSLIFPYDNSRRIRATVETLDKELIDFLEDIFDGDDHLPDPEIMSRTIDDMAAQLRIFSNQKLLMNLRRQHDELQSFRVCEGKARQLLAHMEVLCQLERPGRLQDEIRLALQENGAQIADTRISESFSEIDVVTNFHVKKILALRLELLEALRK